jgi:hypothetical protein
MRIEIFTLCDAATEGGGKLNILGSFDHVWATSEPITYPLCAVALKVRFSRIEEGNHRFKLTFADADGKLVMPGVDASVAIRFGSDDPTVTANVILNIQQIKLEKFGEYTLDAAIDGRHEGSIPLYVRQRKEGS